MKNIILVFSFLFLGVTIQSQEVKKDKNAKVTMYVDGVCGMCKKRIETASLKTSGVKFAFWDVKSHQLNLILDESKTNIATIQKSILAVGHDIILSKDKKLIAAEENYNAVSPCCKYRNEKIVLEHEVGVKKQ
ncbi:MAG: cation transporter [Flavobacteriia bacterium]|nr:cation transporter [Flavobacteriia bacterium]NCT59815.1 cation transporter [Flavobacteriia bacterium]OIP45957.1 MAG: metal transporter [Flavobacteriaceae bacterium CG2_30_31_66]